MKFTVIVPAISGLRNEAGVVMAWRKEIGDAVLTGETLAVVEEAPVIAPVSGILTRKYALVGEAIAVGEPLALLSGVPEPNVFAEAKYALPVPVAASTTPLAYTEEVRRRTPQERELARHDARAAQTAPHIVTVARADVSEALRLAERVGVPLLPFVIHCVAASLTRYPLLNSRFLSDEEIGVSRAVHIAVLRRTGGRLTASVLRDADKRSLLTLARELAELGAAAESGNLPPEAQRGATFTIAETPAGVLYQSAILRQPQAALLTLGPTELFPAPDADASGGFVLRPCAHLCLIHDVRLVDNDTAAAFLADVKQGVAEAKFLFA